VCSLTMRATGAFIERAGGDVWSESNNDGGDWLFDWGVVRQMHATVCQYRSSCCNRASRQTSKSYYRTLAEASG
jgi:hypothetical protein